MDVDSIRPGEDYFAALEEVISSAEVVLVLIGPNWLTAADKHGRRRIDDPGDFVRVELAAALRRGGRIIPVVVGGGWIPSEAELPDELRPLARRNALEVSDVRWDYGVQRLSEAIEDIIGKPRMIKWEA